MAADGVQLVKGAHGKPKVNILLKIWFYNSIFHWNIAYLFVFLIKYNDYFRIEPPVVPLLVMVSMGTDTI